MDAVRVLDLFSGGGGSSYGARAAGATIVAGVDAWDVASATYKSNFGNGLNFRLEGDTVRDEIRRLGPIDLLLASPECTSHTCARGARPKCDDSRMTAFQVIHHASALRPRWIVVENVVQMRSWERYDDFLGELRRLGYGMSSMVLDAADFGVPQTRRRLFVILGRDDGFEFHMPEPSSKPVPARSILDSADKWKVNLLKRAGRAEATLMRAERAFAEVGQKESFLLVYYGSDASGGWQPLDRPLRTLTTLDRFALVEPGPKGHTMRMLQVPELRRAMGFGDDFKLEHGSRRDQVKVLGNGVCPPVLKAIVSAIPVGASHRSQKDLPYFIRARRLAESKAVSPSP
jgi:DNA (cytosine-5)-methyltransferase 1